MLEDYNKNPKAFWQEFWTVANDNVFWALANDISGRKEQLGVDVVQGGGPYFDLSDVKSGYRFNIVRRNLGSLEVSAPDNSAGNSSLASF